MALESAAGLQVAQRRGQGSPEEGACAVPVPGDPVSAEDGLRGPSRQVVPGAAARARSEGRARPRARRDRLVQPKLSAPAGGGPPVGAAGLQYAAVDSADVRVVPAQRDGCARFGRDAGGSGSLRRTPGAIASSCMKILTFSTLYPHAARPNHGIFVETRLRHLLASGKVESKVVAPVPWFPSSNPRFGEYAVFAGVPSEEQRNGIDVIHPRYLAVPKLGMSMAPFLLAAGAY